MNMEMLIAALVLAIGVLVLLYMDHRKQLRSQRH